MNFQPEHILKLIDWFFIELPGKSFCFILGKSDISWKLYCTQTISSSSIIIASMLSWGGFNFKEASDYTTTLQLSSFSLRRGRRYSAVLSLVPDATVNFSQIPICISQNQPEMYLRDRSLNCFESIKLIYSSLEW